MEAALKRELQDRRLLFRERVIMAWVRLVGRPVSVHEICEGLGVALNPTQITMKSLYTRGYLWREKVGMTFIYQVH